MASPLTDLEKTLIFPTHPISPDRSTDDPCDTDVPGGPWWDDMLFGFGEVEESGGENWSTKMGTGTSYK